MKLKRFPPITQWVAVRLPDGKLRHEEEDVTRIFSATITTEHPASSYGKPVLLVDCEPIGTTEAALSDYRIVRATKRERELLELGGYRLQDAEPSR